MNAAKRRFFRTHASKRARTRFVKQQRRKLARLKRARARCLARQLPAPGPPAPDPGGGPPAPPVDPPAEPPATSAIENVVSAAASFEPGEVSEENGVQYVRTQLVLELAPGATVAQMQALLAQLNAQVVSSLQGVPILTVRIPDPGSLATLRALVAGLAGTPGLAHADIPTVPVTTELPSIIPASNVAPVRPQLASFASGAWNARAALTGRTPPTVMVTDYWGKGPPGPEVAVQETAADFATVNPNDHGYTMLGLLAGTFAPGAVSDLAVDQVTGTWPGPDLPLRVVDLSISIANSTLQDRIVQMVQATTGDVVVSTSLAAGCAPTQCTQAQIQTEALQWIQRVRANGLESRLVHVVAAGNIYPNLPNDKNALLGSGFIAAARMALPGGVPNLTNTIVVENTTSSDPSGGPVRPVCLTDTSKRPGDISTVGNDIVSLSGPGVIRNLPLGGTSSAAPQAAGAAAMVWALDSGLAPSEVVGILRHTARPIDVDTSDPRCDSAATPAPGLDQYAAVLAIDNGASQPVRATIMDVADSSGTIGSPDGVFDEVDLDAIRQELTVATVPLDYGRFDLNGDGLTGGGRTRLDLDGVRPVVWDVSARRDILGLKVLHDESRIRDVDVLCHEAAGPRYAGDLTARDAFMEAVCLPRVDIKVDPAFPASVVAGAPTPLRVTATNLDISDVIDQVLPGVRLEFNVTGGTVSAPSGVGTTGADGSFSTFATLDAPASQIQIEIIARAGPGGRELDRVTVSANAGSGSITIGDGQAFLVANAEAADEVIESSEPNFSDTASAADKDATASSTATTALQLSSGGMEFTGSASISASDDGGGGDASAYVVREFTLTQDLFYHLDATLGGSIFGDTTAGVVSLRLASSQNPFYTRTTAGSDSFGGFMSAGTYEIEIEVDCSPGNDGGTCTGNWSFKLEIGDLIGP